MLPYYLDFYLFILSGDGVTAETTVVKFLLYDSCQLYIILYHIIWKDLMQWHWKINRLLKLSELQFYLFVLKKSVDSLW